MLPLITIATFISTLLGGLFALKIRDRLHLVLGFSAGAVIGVAFFDLIPEAIELGGESYGVSVITSIAALGFIFYMLVDRLLIFHSHHALEGQGGRNRGRLGAGSLAVHSFLDGIAIGVAFQVSTVVAVIVSIAVLTHDFSDGINTVSMILKNSGDAGQAFRWLMLDAIAPILGVISTLFFTMPRGYLALLLALFSGFFLYIGASDLLPESHHAHPTIWTTAMTVAGIAMLYFVIRIANI